MSVEVLYLAHLGWSQRQVRMTPDGIWRGPWKPMSATVERQDAEAQSKETTP